MPQLVLGPVLRYVDETDATVWVETDRACEVEVLGCTSKTFQVAGHHYALVHVSGLSPGSSVEYEVALDGKRRWPEENSPFPPSLIQTPSPDQKARLVFGSCRVSVPNEPPYTLRKDQDPRGREIDALHVLARRMCDQDPSEWPTRLLMLGDQVYADEVSPGTRRFIGERRSLEEPPGEQVADFEEYTHLYLDSWGDPTMRWLLSTVGTAMIFDDHDVHDDWNISESWVQDMRKLPWWSERVAGAFMTYWIYQHIGNLAPDHLHEDEMFDAVCAAEGDTAPQLHEFALKADRETEGTRWSFCRDYGRARVLIIDSRAGRVLRDGRRCMIDDDEWGWICERLVGGHDHLIIGTTLPVLLGQAMHYFEAWNEAMCDGARGEFAAKLSEKLRRGMDLEHWAAFGESFDRLMRRLGEVAAGEHGPPPASIVLLSGDVHHAYLTEVAFRRSVGAQVPVYQAVCSPFRNPLDSGERRMIRFGTSRVGHAIGRALARTAGVKDPIVRWRMIEGPYFDNQVATLELHDRSARMTLERTKPGADPGLHVCFSRELT